MTTKRNNTTHNEVVVERVLTSDAFLTREIKKAPMKTTGDSLIADLTHLPNDLKITIQGAREHNLKNVDLEFPRNRMVVFTGLSGSGKSSLAFDTLFAEGQRRYVESLSAYARQFLGQMDKPDVDFIEGLSPAVSIDQKTTNRNPRSTVGTITEIYDYLRLLFARTGIPHCPECGALVSAQTPQQMVDTLLKYPERTRFQILAPVVRGRKTDKEKFAGAEATYTVECMMKDRKALQGATSHYFGDKFSRAYDVTFAGRDNKLQYPFQTSWGSTTRMIGAVIMTHGDNNGLVLPPRIAPTQVVIVPIAAHKNPEVLETAKSVMADLIAADVRVKLDDSDQSMGWKCAEYEMRGVPIRLELGPRDLAEGNCCLVRRDNGEKVTAKIEGIVDEIKALLDAIHDNMYTVAEKNLEDNTFDLKTIDEVKEMAAGRGGFARTKWCGSLECELKMKEQAGVSSRCMPLKQSGTTGKCVCCGKECTTDIYWGVAY